MENVLIEVIKYGSKIFTDPEMNKGRGNIPLKIYACALDNIYEAMEGCRLFGKFGFKLPKVKSYKKTPPKLIQQYQEWIFDAHLGDWLCNDSAKQLTGHVPSPQLQYMLSDVDLVSG